MNIEIYTDGASRGNPGPGGWAAILISGDTVTELAGRMDGATNNQMELMAVKEALTYTVEHFPHEQVSLHADSTYVLKGLESWLYGWERNGWITATKKPVENRALWESLLTLRRAIGSHLELIKVAGHSGHEYNDRCDELAVQAALNKDFTLYTGSLAGYREMLIQNPPRSETKTTKPKTGPAYSYVSYVDGRVYTDKTWAACEARVKGTKGAKFKKVFSKDEETSLIQEYTLSSLS
jgi:ribonuclease HI